MSGLVAEAESTHEIITITKHGRAVAALISADDLESLHETLYWLAKPDIADAISAAERDYAAGATTSGDDLRTEFGLPGQ